VRTVINPEGMEAIEWFDRTTQIFDDLFPPFVLSRTEEWRDWAASARRAQSQVPDPYQFASWSDWADRFNQVMSLSEA
jgi:hypothetical protein